MLKESQFRKIIRESVKETIKEATSTSGSPGPKGYAAFLKDEDLKAYMKNLKRGIELNTGYKLVNELHLKRKKGVDVTYDQAKSTEKLDKQIKAYIEDNYPEDYNPGVSRFHGGMDPVGMTGKQGHSLSTTHIMKIAKFAKTNKDNKLAKLIDQWVKVAKANDLIETVNEAKHQTYTVEWWQYTRDDDYDRFDVDVKANSKEDAIAKAQKANRNKGKDYTVIQINGKTVKESVNEATKSKYHTIVVYNGTRLAVDNADIPRLKSGKDVVGKSLKYAGQEEWILAKGKWKIEESVNEAKYFSLEKGDKLKVKHPTYKNLIFTIIKPKGSGYEYIAQHNKGKDTNWAPAGYFSSAIKNGDAELIESVNEGIFKDKRDLVGYEVDSFIGNYKKINPKNTVKIGSDGFVYGFRKGDKDGHWKLDKDSGTIYSDSNAEVGNLIHRTSGAKIWK